MILGLGFSTEISHSSQSDSSSLKEFEKKLDEAVSLFKDVSLKAKGKNKKKGQGGKKIRKTSRNSWSFWVDLSHWGLADLKEQLAKIDRRIEDFSFEMDELKMSLVLLPKPKNKNCDLDCKSRRKNYGKKIKALRNKIGFEKIDRKSVSDEISSRKV